MTVAGRTVALLVALLLVAFLLPAKQRPVDPESVKHGAQQYGVGADLKLILTDGHELRGRLETLSDETFGLRSKANRPVREVRYDEVTELRLARLVLRAAGSPDPAEARRVALGLGVGKKVVTKLADGKVFRGRIESIQDANFVLRPNDGSESVPIPYQEVRSLEQKHMSGGVKAAIIAAAAGVALVIFLAWLEGSD